MSIKLSDEEKELRRLEINRKKREKYILNRENHLKRCKEYRVANPEKEKERYKKYDLNNRNKRNDYYKNNKDVIDIKHLNYRNKNKKKVSLCSKNSRLKNKDKYLLKDKEYRDNNKESHKQYLEDNKCILKEKRDIKYQENKQEILNKNAEYRRNNKGIINSINSRRRAVKLQATIKLTELDKDYIKHLYIQAKELQKLDGTKYHVDHIVPLQGENVCGLHVPWNLQILTAEENCKKYNKVICQ
jgi:hypothetical protein